MFQEFNAASSPLPVTNIPKQFQRCREISFKFPLKFPPFSQSSLELRESPLKSPKNAAHRNMERGFPQTREDDFSVLIV